MSKHELNAIVDRLISIKDNHESDLSRLEVDAINKACNALEDIANEQK